MTKVLDFSFSFSSANWYSGLISFRIDWFAFLAIQGTLKSLLQHESSKPSILGCSAFFMIQLTDLYMATGETIALTRQTFVSKVVSLLFNTLSRFVIAFPPRNKCLNCLAAVTICSDFGVQENKVCQYFHFLPCLLPWSDGTRYHDHCFLKTEF